MIKELNIENYMEKVGNNLSKIKTKIIGNGRKTAALLASVLILNGYASPTEAKDWSKVPAMEHKTLLSVESNQDKSFDLEIQKMKNYLVNFNNQYTNEEQKALITSGYYVSEKTGAEANTLEKIVELTKSSHEGFVKRTGSKVSLEKYSDLLSKQATRDGFDYDSVPQFIVTGVESKKGKILDLENPNQKTTRRMKLK